MPPSAGLSRSIAAVQASVFSISIAIRTILEGRGGAQWGCSEQFLRISQQSPFSHVWPSSSCLNGTNSSFRGVHQHSLEVGRESRQNSTVLAHRVLSCTFALTHSLEISIRERAECTPLVQDPDSVLRLSSFLLFSSPENVQLSFLGERTTKGYFAHFPYGLNF